MRFSGSLVFGGYNLDLTEPRDVEGLNVWRISPTRLYGDAYDVKEWLADSLPERADCAGHLAAEVRRDATNLVVGSKVCGRTPGGRIFRIEVLGLADRTITGHVVVWA
ncbi:hypothetical protein BN6_83700 [Saccharothrix espanaensis DSM 44229]|uniref:Uncharacterized protein n=1 Tax=Saccharothrix espanaensis (strain ATCC 51144 / DSM 44229 / JCM 9112 / NBRC 15066 / NRRL 15764) TaxID=1179773 RepID=K0KBP9_SACES|nr:hypothetical protein BN6_83700 [Saccharothrix espanaensis DSM 44229]